jgi:hypothetical protein
MREYEFMWLCDLLHEHQTFDTPDFSTSLHCQAQPWQTKFITAQFMQKKYWFASCWRTKKFFCLLFVVPVSDEMFPP